MSRVKECKAVLEGLENRTFGTFYVEGTWQPLSNASMNGVTLQGRSTTGDVKQVDATDAELMSKLLRLAGRGTGQIGAEHNGVEFCFER